MKKCKYCMSKIDENAIVCPVCKRNLVIGDKIKKIDNAIKIIIYVVLGLSIIALASQIISHPQDYIDLIRG